MAVESIFIINKQRYQPQRSQPDSKPDDIYECIYSVFVKEITKTQN
ncbi:MAG: erythromycin resistance leader peptide [Cyclobacteriaceae bacterium]|nr:erythromycin resistance leader peptide [Cyclobacteriaceae bacterium]